MFYLKPRSTSVSPTNADGGEDDYIIANDVTGTAFLATEAAARFATYLDGETSLAAAAGRARLPEDQAKFLANQLLAHGLIVVPGATVSQPKAPKPVEGRLIFFRVNLFDVRGLVERVLWLSKCLFSRAGFVAWILTLCTALIAVASQPEATSAAFRELLNISVETGILLSICFILLKVIHELGHASSLRIFTEKEGIALGPIRAGISFFALLPFPFTDTTVAWKIRSKRRRAVIGFAGIYVESWVAALAAILWANVAPGELQTVLFQILLIAGFSTLLFNLNPLVRLDGYYIFSDFFDLPNMGTRSALAARRVGVWLIGGPRPVFDRFHLTYWTLSYAYRWVIFAGIFWLSYSVDPRLSWLVAAVSVMTLIIRPIIAVIKMSANTPLSKMRLFATCGLVAAILLSVLIPVRDAVQLDGHLVRYEQTLLRSDETAYIEYVRPAGTIADESGVLGLRNPDLSRQLTELEMDGERVASRLRQARSTDPIKIEIFNAERRSIDDQRVEIASRLASLSPSIPVNAVWQPRDAEKLAGAWVGAYHNRVLGAISEPTEPYIDVFVGQDLSDLGSYLVDGSLVEFRPVSDVDCVGSGEVADFQIAQNTGVSGFRLKVSVDGNSPCVTNLPEGSGMVVRVVRSDASVARQLYNAAIRIAQNRLPQDVLQP